MLILFVKGIDHIWEGSFDWWLRKKEKDKKNLEYIPNIKADF